MVTQNVRVLQYMRDFGSITQLDAMKDLGVMRLASRISDLKKQGYKITSTTDTAKNRYNETTHFSRYKLIEKGETDD